MAATNTGPQDAGTPPGVGIAAGWTSGIGFAYRQHFDNWWGIQAAGGALGFPSGVGSSLGVEVIRTFSLEKDLRFYGFAALATQYAGNSGTEWENHLYPIFGAGLGVEIRFGHHVALALEVPLALTTSYDGTSFKFVSVLPIPSASMVYYF